MATPSQSPTRFPNGVSTDFPYQPFANYGLPDPSGYGTWFDDFFVKESTYTTTATGNGTAAITANTNANAMGELLFTTNSSTPAGSDLVSLQLAAAPWLLQAGKKAFFGTRLKLSSATNAAFRVGMFPTGTTPFTGNQTNALYFDKATGSLTNINLVNVSGGTAVTTAVPTNAYTLANATYIDLAWYLDRNANLYGFIGAQLFGWLPQSGVGSSPPARGPAVASNAITLPAAAMNMGLAVQSGTAASSTMTVDFWFGAVER
jgi:hypothetical protein